MTQFNAFRADGAVAGVLAGSLLALGHLLNLGSASDYGTVPGTTLVLVAHVLLVFALVGIAAAQAERAGLLGRVATVLTIVGTTLVSGVVLVEVAGASGLAVSPVFEAPVAAAFATLGAMAFFVGMLLLGVATVRAGVFSRPVGALLFVGTLVFGLGTVAGSLEPLGTLAGAVLTGAGFVWAGRELLGGRTDSESTGRATATR